MRADVIDLSHYDNVSDGFAGAVRMGVQGAINKVSEGLGYVDPSFAWRRGPAARRGLLYGGYHFLRPGNPRQQASHFLDHVGDPAGLRLALDHEDPDVSMNSARAWLETVAARIGHFPHYYSYQSFIHERRGDMDTAFWRQVQLWLAAYNRDPQWPHDIWPEAPDLWQFTGDGNGPSPHQVPGILIAGGCDINQARDRATLAARWATIPGAAPPAPTPEPPPAPGPAPGPAGDPAVILHIAAASEIAHYQWSGRGHAPLGYTKGMALTFAKVLRSLQAGDPAALLMARANTHDANTDALSWYAGAFNALGMGNDTAGADTLRHVFALLMGLGMRESSGVCTEGRDTSTSNTTSDTAEAGLFQQSWNSHAATPEIARLMAAYSHDQADGFGGIFREGVAKPVSDDYGAGAGRTFQHLCKTKPAFAVEAAAVGLRTIRKHWGPIERREAELRVAADTMLKQVQEYLG